MKFDKNQHFIKHRSMNGVWYEQNGHRFSSGFAHLGKMPEGKSNTGTPEPDKKDLRESARKKIQAAQAKKGSLEGFKTPEVPTAMQSAAREDAAVAAAEENAP